MSSDYWDSRANMEYEYKGEKFYTITAVPYYFKRREIILKYIKKTLNTRNQICDFGCGDGEYVKILSENYSNVTFHCVDISEDMIKIAKSRNTSIQITWEVSGYGIHDNRQFDYVYSSAIFAHISDDVMLLPT